MARILMAYATSEGQTARIMGVLAEDLMARGHETTICDLADRAAWPDPARFEAAILAASVHAGKHQGAAVQFVTRHKDALAGLVTAFVSVSLSAAATTDIGRARAAEQAEAFFSETAWHPEQVERLAGAMRASRLSWFKRGATWVAQRLFRTELSRLGWPDDLTRDAEFTDWEAVRRFAERFAGRL